MTHVLLLFKYLKNLLKVLGAFCLAGMMLLTCIDVVGRRLGHPIFGSVEIVGFMATLTVAFALPYTHEMKGHIGVEILVQHFSERTQAVFEFFTHLIAAAFFLVVTWRMTVYGNTIRNSGEVSMNLEFPIHVIIYLCAFCFLLFSLTIFEDIAANFKKMMKQK